MTDLRPAADRSAVASTSGAVRSRRADRPDALRSVAVGGGAVLGAAALSYVGRQNPHDPAVVMPTCPVHWLTGLDCPGCGGLRMTHDLLHGDLAAAFADNAVLLVLAPLLLFLIARSTYRWTRRASRPAAGRYELNGRLGYALATTAFVWMLVRNVVGH